MHEWANEIVIESRCENICRGGSVLERISNDSCIWVAVDCPELVQTELNNWVSSVFRRKNRSEKDSVNELRLLDEDSSISPLCIQIDL